MNLCIIIPSYNEEKRIEETIKDYSGYDLLVVLNGTTDNSKELLDSLGISYIELQEKGKGLAVLKGFEKAYSEGYEWIGFIDADGSAKREDFEKFLEHLDYPVIIGQRETKDMSLKRQIGHNSFNRYVNWKLGLDIEDTQAGCKLFKRETVKYLLDNAKQKGWAFDVEWLYLLMKKGIEIREVPIQWIEKKNSKTQYNTPIEMIKEVSGIKKNQIAKANTFSPNPARATEQKVFVPLYLYSR